MVKIETCTDAFTTIKSYISLGVVQKNHSGNFIATPCILNPDMLQP